MREVDKTEFRTATMADHATVVGLLREYVDELGPDNVAPGVSENLHDDFYHALGSATIRVFVAEQNHVVIGVSRVDILTQDPTFRLRHDKRCGYIDQMFVRKAYRYGGIGQSLLQLCEDWLQSQSITYVLLHADPKAVRFYAQIGYLPNRQMYKKL